MGRKGKLIQRIFRSALSVLLVLSMTIPVLALDKNHYTPHAPKDDYGMNFIVFDETMSKNEAGKYDGTMTARLSGNLKTCNAIVGGVMRWYWDVDLPEPVLENTPKITSPRPVELDSQSGLNMKRAVFHYSMEADKGAFVEGENGEGYKEFQLKFKDVTAVPGQIFRTKIEDHYNKDLGDNGESTLLIRPIDPDMENTPIERGEVIEGQLRAPGRTITYKSDINGTQTYEQIYETDEELKGKTFLSLEDVGFQKGTDAKFLGWSTKPDALNETQFLPGQPLDKKGADGRYLINNVTLYPVWESEEHLDGPWVDYVVSDTTAVKESHLANGYYDATMNVRIIADMQRIPFITFGSLEWSWPERLGDGPEMLNLPESESDQPNYRIPEDAGLNLISKRRIFKWWKNPNKGALTPMNDGSGYGYHEFQMRFKNVKGEPGEVIPNIRLRDYHNKQQDMSTVEGETETGEAIETFRCHVKTGSIRIPGITITYMSDDTESAKKYKQTFYTDEEVSASAILNNDPTQNVNQPLTMPNFEAPKGKDFAGWSTTPNDTQAMYQPGDPLNMGNVILYPVWKNKDSYTITYDGNGGTPDRDHDDVLIGESIQADMMPSVTHNEKYIFLGWFTEREGGVKIEGLYTPEKDTTLYAHWEKTYKVLYSAGNGTGEVVDENSPYRKGDSVYAKNPDGLTSPGEGWVFEKWESNIPLQVMGKEETSVYLNERFIMPEQDVTLTAVWSNTISDICPLVLDLTNGTLQDKKGNKVDTGFTNNDRTGIALNEEAFKKCTANHTHVLIVKGSTEKPVAISGAVDVYVNGVTAREFYLETAGTVTFGSNEDVMTNTFNATGKQGLVLGKDVKAIKINDGISVIGISDAKKKNPVEGLNGKARLLDLSMYEKTNDVRTIYINNKEVSLPKNYERICVLDNVDGTWLANDISVTDGKRAYVRGVGQDENDKYADGKFSEKNVYGQTFSLSGTESEAEGVGRYDAVRLPKNIKQLTVNVPTRIVFNIYTNKSNPADTGFIGPQYELNNGSYTCEDEIQYNQETLMFNKTNASVDISYNGINKNSAKENMYTLRKYEAMDSDTMQQSVEKPIVCLEMSANGANRVSLDEIDGTVANWFNAPEGISKVALMRPEAYEQSMDSNVKRYYQIPKLVEEQDMVLRGYHTVKLGFRIE